MRLLVVICLFLLNCFVVSGQQLYVQRYSEHDYQGADQSWGFVQDKKGVLYVANNDGVLRYDGAKWDILEVPGQHYTFSIDIDSAEKLYIGSFNELGYFQKNVSGRYLYHSLINLLPDSLQHVKNILQTIVYNDTVLFKSPDHVYIYYGGHFSIVASIGKLQKLGGRPWLRDASGLHDYCNRKFGAPYMPEEFKGIGVLRVRDYVGKTWLVQDEKAHLWVFDPDEVPGKKLHAFPAALEESLMGAPILNYMYLDNGTIVMLLEKGLLFTDKGGRLVNFISRAVFDTDISFGRWYQDKHHNLWLSATAFYIFQIITSSPLSFFDKDNGITGGVICLGMLGGVRYVGSSQGIFYQRPDRRFYRIEGIQGETWNFYNFGDKLYVAQETGVFEVRGNEARKLIAQSSVHCLCQLRGSPGRFLMGTFNDGIWVVEKGINNIWTKRKVKGFDEEIRFLQEDRDGNIWAGSLADGIYKLQLNPELDSVTGKTHYDRRSGLPYNANNRIFRLRNGNLLALTSDGVYGYDRENNRFTPVKEFRQSIPEGWSVNSMAEGGDGDIYIRGGQGELKGMAGVLHRQPDGNYSFHGISFAKLATKMQRVYADRIEDDEPLLIASPCEVWLGEKEKLVVYDPTKKTFFNDSILVGLDRVKAGDSSVFNGEKTGGSSVDIAFSRNKLEFDLFTTFFENSEDVEYQYRLEGWDNRWSTWTREHTAVFMNLAEGEYIFWARARNIYGKIGSTLPFVIHIRPPWYRSWLAIVCYLLGLFGVRYAVVGLYTRRVRLKNRVLERKIQEKTREIAESAQKLQELNTTKDRLFSIISHDLRGPIGTMKAVVDLMKNAKMSEQDVQTFGKELGDHLFVTGQLLNNLLSWSKAQMGGVQPGHTMFALWEIAEEACLLFKTLSETRGVSVVNSIPVSCQVYADKDIVRTVVRNIVNNAVKFTRSGGEVVVGALRDGNSMEVFVQDAGGGISEEGITRIIHKQSFHKPDTAGQIGAGLGLLLCQELLEKDGRGLLIKSLPEEGSRFSFLVPLANADGK